jgi:hypothetical protein
VTIPATLRDLTPEWLTHAMATTTGQISTVCRIEFATEPKRGITGETATLILQFDDARTDTFFAKLPPTDELTSFINSSMLFYQRECGFYDSLAAEVPTRVPVCHANVLEGDRGFLLLDLMPGTAGQVDLFPGADTAAAVLAEIAQFHGKFWGCDTSLRPWLVDWIGMWVMGLLKAAWPAFRAANDDIVSDEISTFLEATVLDNTSLWLRRFAQRESTLIHGDFKLDNIVFDATGFAFVDWQNCMVSFPGVDLAGLFGLCTAEHLDDEGELLRLYARELSSSGGPTLSVDYLLDDLAWSLLFWLPGVAAALVQDFGEVEEGELDLRDRLRSMVRGYLDAARRWDLIARVGSS